jgi:FKBP-type peptidyl-prolyl cis-trans isomerase FkpA
MIKIQHLLFTLLVLIVACSSEKETPNGMKYKVLKEVSGDQPHKGQFLVFHYQLKDDKDSVWSSTWNEGIPAYQPISDSSNIASEDGMRQMLRTLSVGDSVTTTMTIGEFFRTLVHAPAPRSLDTTRTVSYTIVPQAISSPQEYFASREPLVAKRDSITINKFLEKNQLTAQGDSSGLRYIIYNNSGGAKPRRDDCVEVKYAGRFMRNGRIFDAAEVAAFQLNNNIIPGWQRALTLLGKGDSATFFIPSRLGYGMKGFPNAIPPDAILIFDMTLLDIKKEFDRGTRTCK